MSALLLKGWQVRVGRTEAACGKVGDNEHVALMVAELGQVDALGS